jgi:MFS transporter, DHA1 family, tetracycline resistance protein
MSTITSPSAKRTASMGFIFATVLIDVIGFGIIIPIVPDLLEELTGQKVNEASGVGGMLMASFALMQFLFSPIVGALSDKYGRRPILLFSLLGLGIDYLLSAFAPTLAWLFAGRILAGMFGASFTTANAYIADISTDKNRGQNFGMIGVAFGVGFIVGPLLGGLIGEHFGTRAPFFVAAGLSLINMIYGYFILPESLPKEKRRGFSLAKSNPFSTLFNLKKFPVLQSLMFSFLCIYVAAHAVQSNWTFYTKYRFMWSNADIGWSLAAVGLLVAIVQGGLIRIILPKWGLKTSILVGFILYGLGLAGFGFANAGWLMFAFLAPYCLGGIAGPALQSVVSGQVPINQQGELQGTLTSLMSLSAIIGPVLMNGVFKYFTADDAPINFPGAAFILGAILTFISTALLIKPLRAYNATAAKAQ